MEEVEKSPNNDKSVETALENKYSFLNPASEVLVAVLDEGWYLIKILGDEMISRSIAVHDCSSHCTPIYSDSYWECDECHEPLPKVAIIKLSLYGITRYNAAP